MEWLCAPQHLLAFALIPCHAASPKCCRTPPGVWVLIHVGSDSCGAAAVTARIGRLGHSRGPALSWGFQLPPAVAAAEKVPWTLAPSPSQPLPPGHP